jgi:hypothetical protein
MYFQHDLQIRLCNKLYYCSTQKSLIPFNFDGSYDKLAVRWTTAE